MKNNQNRRAVRLSRLALGVGVGSILMLPTVVMAQADPTADETIWGKETASVGGDNGAASSLLDMIQRGQVGSTQSRADFLEKQTANLDDVTAAFRRQQLEAFEVPSAPAAQPEKPLELEETEEEDLRSRAVKNNPRRALW